MLPLHIKLGLVKQSVKALDFEDEVFQKIRLMFLRLQDAKIKGGIFVSPLIDSMLKSTILEEMRTKWKRKRGERFEVWLMDFWKMKRIEITQS